jgi:hypothetical protein
MFENPIWNAYPVLIMLLYLPFGLILLCVTIVQICGLFVSGGYSRRVGLDLFQPGGQALRACLSGR